MLFNSPYSNIVSLKSADDLHEYLKQFRGDSTWKFRGQSVAKWPLIPKAGRIPYSDYDDKTLFCHWKRGANQFLPNKSYSELEFLAIAQHHGLPTRLLDWSHSPLTAAFFAAVNNPNEDGALYAIKYDRFVTDGFDPFRQEDKIWLYQPTLNVPRLARQMGYFSIHCNPKTDLTLSGFDAQQIDKVLIKKSIKQDLLLMLNQYGTNYLHIYPDLEGLSMHLTWYSENIQHLNGQTVSKKGSARPLSLPPPSGKLK